MSKADAPIQSLREERVKQGESWFSLFFWPAFRRVFLPAANPRVAESVTHRRSRHTATNAKTQNVLEFPVPRVIIDAQMESWVRWILETKYGDRENGLDGNDDGGSGGTAYFFGARAGGGTEVYWRVPV